MEASTGNDNKDCSSMESNEAASVECGIITPESNIARPSKEERLEKRRRLCLFIFSAMTGTLFAGAFFSWGPMQLLLEAHGVFEDRCEEGEATPCPAQTTRLLTVQFVAQFAIVFSPILGLIADRFGPIMLMYVATTTGCLGLGLLTLAVSVRLDNLVFVAFFLVGVMAMSFAVNTVQVGMLFNPVTRQRVISALNTLFDAGLLTYLALWGIQELTGCSLPALLSGYFAVGIVCFGGSIYYWHVAEPVDKHDVNEDTEENDEGTGSGNTTDVIELGCSSPSPDNVPLGTDKPDMAILESQPHPSSEMKPGAPDVETGTDEDEFLRVRVDASASDAISKDESEYVLIADRLPMQQLKSKQFVTLTIFFAIHATRDMFNLTTARDFLAYLGDDELGNKYLTIYTLLTPASIMGLPFLDFVLTHYGYHAGLQIVNMLAMGQGIIMVSSDNLNVQVLGFIFASFFRCFMYTISLGILPTFLGANAVGTASGTMPCVAGVLALVNILLASWAVNGLGGNFFYPNLIYTITVVPCIYAAWVLGQGIKREDAAKK